MDIPKVDKRRQREENNKGGLRPISGDCDQLKTNCASTVRTDCFGCPSSAKESFFTYCCRLLSSASRLHHLAKHFSPFKCDIVGLFDRLFRNLLAVQVEFDFFWRNADVQLQDKENEWRSALTNLSRLFGHCRFFFFFEAN